MIRFLVGVALLMYLLQRFQHNLPIQILAVALYIISALSFIMGIDLLAQSIRIFGADLLGLRKSMSSLRYRSLNTGGIAAVMNGVLGIILVVLSVTMGFNWLSEGALLLSICFWTGLRRSLPPMALLLGASSMLARDLYSALHRAVLPLSAVNLLDVEQDSFPSVARVDTQRTRTVPWREQVKELAGIAKLILIDVRVPSQAVEEEIQMVMKEGQQHKVIFVASEEGKESALKMLAAIEPSASKVATYAVAIPEEAIDMVRRLVRSPNALPTHTRPISDLLVGGMD